MKFTDLCLLRESCRSYDAEKMIPEDVLSQILECARLSPSACNGQPYHITVCRGEKAKEASQCVMGMGMNKFAADAQILLVISEKSYVPSAALGAKVKKNDYRSIDIGILAAYLTAEATAQGLSTCILGWLDDGALRAVCNLEHPVRLVITLGYAAKDDPMRDKKRKTIDELVTYL